MNQLKTIWLLGILSLILLSIGYSLGKEAFYASMGAAVVMNFVSYFFSDKIVLAVSKAREISQHENPGLHSMVDHVARSAGIKKPRVFIIPGSQPNAFATGRSPEKGVVAFTEGIIDLLNEDELKGVTAHEISHIKNRDILVATVATVMASAITYAVNILAFLGQNRSSGDGSSDGGRSVIASVGLLIVAPLAASLIQLAISRSREYLADDSAARLTKNPEGLASALEKLHRGVAETDPSESAIEPATASLYIVNPLSAGDIRSRFSSWFSTHPPIEERIARLRSMSLGYQ